MKEIIVGSKCTCEWIVTEERLAVNVESGDLRVLATPVMAALMEKAAAQCLGEFLDEGETSVGTALDIAHTSATPIGMKFEATATITSYDGRKVDFEVSANDEAGEIGKGTHSRFVVNAEKFQTKTNSKKA
ncbi:MAG: hypothetical protein E7509_05210 [Ruminococcus sp.]|nr:hypothetical protein [Ruminococcus sp.]